MHHLFQSLQIGPTTLPNPPDPALYYTAGAKSYTDYPFLEKG